MTEALVLLGRLVTSSAPILLFRPSWIVTLRPHLAGLGDQDEPAPTHCVQRSDSASDEP